MSKSLRDRLLGLGTYQWDTTTSGNDTEMGWGPGPGEGGWEAGGGYPPASRPWGSSAPVTPPRGASRGRFPRNADECRWEPYKIGPGTGKGRAKDAVTWKIPS